MTTRIQHHLQNHLGFLILSLTFIALFITLGIWQIHRYHYKKNLLNTYQHNLASPPKAFLPLTKTTDSLQFQHVFVTGHYLDSLLIQNQFHQNQIGFEVLTPLQIPGEKKLLLIDRGWVLKNNPVTAPTGEQRITGYIKLLNEYRFILGKNILEPNTKPLTMQKIDIDELSHITGESYFPYILRLDPNEPHGFARNWMIVSAPPERHLAYAVQWFLLAIAVVILFVYFCFSRERSQS